MDRLASHVSGWLHELCREPDRHPGRTGNRAATELFARVAGESGLEVSTDELECVDFERGNACLSVGGDGFDVRSGPYSKPCDVRARLAAAATLEELETGRFRGSVLVLHGELCREQLTPKGFPFYELPGHGRIIAALEAQGPAAIVAATGRNPGLAGGAYPFPLLEDSAVEIPNAFLTDVEGARLLRRVGEIATLRLATRRIAARAQHVVARAPGRDSTRVVFFGHVDSKDGTPGALDNATGTATLLGLAELLSGRRGRHTIELVPLNGEDYFGVPGEKRFVADNEGRWGEIVLGLNVDGAGWRDHGTEVSMYGCSPEVEAAVRSAVDCRPGFAIGEAWYQSDHGLFLQHGRPAVAVTSGDFAELLATVAHTERDTLDLVDPSTVAEIARLFLDVTGALDAIAA